MTGKPRCLEPECIGFLENLEKGPSFECASHAECDEYNMAVFLQEAALEKIGDHPA